MQCSGCGADISAAGSVCPFCGRDKSDDKRYEWTKFIGGIIGLVIGFSTFDTFLAAVVCFFPGYVAGAIFSGIFSGKKKLSKPEVVSQPTQPKAKDSVEDKLTQLKKMHEQGLLTAEEYAKKKEEILDLL